MPDNYVEKSFLYLLILSLLLHAGVFALFLVFPQQRQVVRQEPIMIDLEDIPDLSPQPPATDRKEARRFAEDRHRVPREMAPRGDMDRDRIASLPSRQQPRMVPRPAPAQREPTAREPAPSPGDIPVREPSQGGGGVLRPRTRGENLPEMAQLMPSAERLAKIEDNYRKRFSEDVAEGDTKFLDTDDIQFGSFLRRFENAVYGVWRYPADAARLGIEGVVPVKITFNRSGEIEKYEILQGSGSRILDDEVGRTLSTIKRGGTVGGFPRGYTKDHFHLVAFFQYGIVRGASRSLR
ncbi:TonB family protein [Geobacter sulfurreducens]|jgi:protein TonB|uniref:Periplasmic energy transduction protein, TonB-related protein n=1 Tax=Geobacter sulfurreducens (strain ATCC 51573 / DSM 12127 / PCA) TaxID=243231 RepID=Q74EV1_GEOSL|nr:energy transducer TonB [Geobacter sulfurreducens]AAR34188.1 periplasmic energy transduction protein, TonB-related protein [Geobacter sulfurreducens PCA]ADI83702.2 periplasmic energy transduction protein, TonB-related [Geobacter sulfurreducens KN400]AJY70598.1 TonB-dependent receptor [Geobacter sulfurreducens]UAC04916.1 TonB family protein [Geobacter sulfurreducens]HCD96803.1 TonB family protein [Geobacter sulfurreducens]